MRNLIRLIKLSANYKFDVGLNLLFNIIGMFFSLFSFAMVIPVLRIIFNTETKEKTSNSESIQDWLQNEIAHYVEILGDDALMSICIFLVVMVFFKNLFTYLSSVFLSNVIHGIARDLRKNLYEKIMALQLSYFSNERKGDILSKFSSDVREVEVSLTATINAAFKDPFYILGYLITLFVISVKLSLFIIVFLPVAGLIISLVSNSLKKKTNEGQEDSGRLLAASEESLYGLRIIKSFNAEGKMKARYAKRNQNLYRLMIGIFRRVYIASPLSEFLGVTATAGVLIYGGNLVFQGEITPDFFIGYLILFSQLISPFKSISKAIYEASRGGSALTRIEKVLNEEVMIKDQPDSVVLESFKGSLSFNNVSFSYKKEHVLRNIYLSIKKGQTIALVGQSGSGKTTMADLVTRFYDVVEGSITINDIDIRKFTLHSLRSCIGVVTQDSILFNDTVKNNISFGIENTSFEEIVSAATTANAHDFIVELENGYETNIGDGGNKLSGGQRQRLSIARAILKNPDLLILDEATSALDTESEKLVQQALNRLMQNRTSLVIAHRLSTIQHADMIIVLNKGQIVEKGTHKELLEEKGFYKRFIELQSLA